MAQYLQEYYSKIEHGVGKSHGIQVTLYSARKHSSQLEDKLLTKSEYVTCTMLLTGHHLNPIVFAKEQLDDAYIRHIYAARHW